MSGLFSLIRIEHQDLILMANVVEIKQEEYDKRLQLWKQEFLKRIMGTPYSVLSHEIWDTFIKTCGQNPDYKLILYLNWEDILSLLCVSKTTHDQMQKMLKYEKKLHLCPDRKLGTYWYSKLIPYEGVTNHYEFKIKRLPVYKCSATTRQTRSCESVILGFRRDVLASVSRTQ